jgi:hypothetical protein
VAEETFDAQVKVSEPAVAKEAPRAKKAAKGNKVFNPASFYPKLI